MINRTDILAEARSCLGTPYVHQGRLKGIGLDCAGLVADVISVVAGIPEEETPNYSRYADGVKLVEELRKYLTEVERDPLPGDVLVFWIIRADLPQHVAICSDVGMIHTYSDVGKVVEHRITQAWQDRLVTVFEIPGAGTWPS